MKIAIDIGHARGTGARGNGLQEHEVCTKIAAELAEQLRGWGIDCDVLDFPGLTNAGDLAETVRAVNAGGYGLCVSLHCDCAQRVVGYETIHDEEGIEYQRPILEDDPRARGAHVIYTSAAGGRCAGYVAKHLCALLPGRANRTVKRDNLYVLNNTRCPAVLVECGFLTNRNDADMLRNGLGAVARSIASGLREWVQREV